MTFGDIGLWDWGSIVKTIIGAGVGSAIIQGLLPYLRDRRHRADQAAYMSLRLAVTLEFYTLACADFVQKNQNAQRPPEAEYPDWDPELPELPPYPDDIDGWRAVDRGLASACLNLRNAIHASRGLVNATIEYSMDDLGDVLTEQAAKRGIEAWRIASKLRRVSNFDPVENSWDFVSMLETKLKSATASKQHRQERNADIMLDLDKLTAPE